MRRGDTLALPTLWQYFASKPSSATDVKQQSLYRHIQIFHTDSQKKLHCTEHFWTMHIKRTGETKGTGINNYDTNCTVQPAASLTLAEGLSSYDNYTLKASLRRYSSLAISSATQPGISGMATWMTYFRRIAKCCKPPQRDRLNTWLHQGTITFFYLLCLCSLINRIYTVTTTTKNSRPCTFVLF